MQGFYDKKMFNEAHYLEVEGKVFDIEKSQTVLKHLNKNLNAILKGTTST